MYTVLYPFDTVIIKLNRNGRLFTKYKLLTTDDMIVLWYKKYMQVIFYLITVTYTGERKVKKLNEKR